MSETTRDLILKSAAKILANEGLDALSIRSVCAKAGVKAPTVYHYFNDKEGLVEAVIGLAYKKHTKTYMEFAKERSSSRALVKTWDSFFEFVEKDPELFHAIVVAHIKRQIPPEGLQLFASIADIFKKLEEKQMLNYPFADAAEMFYAAAYGQALVYVSQNQNPNLLPIIRTMRDMCIRGLLVQK